MSLYLGHHLCMSTVTQDYYTTDDICQQTITEICQPMIRAFPAQDAGLPNNDGPVSTNDRAFPSQDAGLPTNDIRPPLSF